jgi:hypothetical protein
MLRLRVGAGRRGRRPTRPAPLAGAGGPLDGQAVSSGCVRRRGAAVDHLESRVNRQLAKSGRSLQERSGRLRPSSGPEACTAAAMASWSSRPGQELEQVAARTARAQRRGVLFGRRGSI